jgi:CheY-like chemotaxis protein
MSTARILVVEDDAACVMDLESRLIELGYQVLANCATGEEAVQQALKLHPDLILMDITLKGEKDGIEAAEEIRAHESIAVIYLSESSDEATFQRAKLTEPYAYLQKPISSQELHFAIDVAVYKHALHQGVSDQLQLLTAMCMVDEAILNSHDPHHALRVALHQITFQLDLDASAVLLFDPSNHSLEYF